MDYTFSKHAEEQMQRRNINRKDIDTAMLYPDQMLADSENTGITIYHFLLKENEQMFLLRVFVNTIRNPNVIVTLYKTTKIQKYYESKI
jgi:hypothetical protein